VTRMPDSEIPEAYAGAYVPAFAVATTHQRALGRIIPELAKMGWQFVELVQNRVDEMEAEHWDAFMDATWPELKAQFPDHAAIQAMIDTDGGCFYGPFAVWGPDSDQQQTTK